MFIVSNNIVFVINFVQFLTQHTMLIKKRCAYYLMIFLIRLNFRKLETNRICNITISNARSCYKTGVLRFRLLSHAICKYINVYVVMLWNIQMCLCGVIRMHYIMFDAPVERTVAKDGTCCGLVLRFVRAVNNFWWLGLKIDKRMWPIAKLDPRWRYIEDRGLSGS